MKNKIKKLLGMEYEIDNKIFLRALRLYPYMMDEFSDGYLRNITKVWATKRQDETTVHIKTHSPGILIGKRGLQIARIKEYMQDLYKGKVKIDIVEEDMFRTF